jgi:hypothetical protein
VRLLNDLDVDHESYFFDHLPDFLTRFCKSISAIGFLHDHGEKHGDIRRDHIIIDAETDAFRWIDFDYNYRHRENIFGYDLFGLGNILIYLVGKGDTLVSDLAKRHHDAMQSLNENDVNIVFRNRVANLKKIYPYIPTALNRVLMHFSKGSNRFYEDTRDLLEDLAGAV